MEISEIINQTVTVESSQSTYLIVRTTVSYFKITFKDKKEFRLKIGTTAPLRIYNQHPLLIDYNFNFETTFINSKVIDITAFTEDLKNAIDQVTLGWRDWKSYIEQQRFFTIDTFKKNLRDGSGRLTETPRPITEKVTEVCCKHKALIKTFDADTDPAEYKLLMIGNIYVIALEFYLEEMK